MLDRFVAPSQRITTRRNRYLELGFHFMAIFILSSFLFHTTKLLGFGLVGLGAGYIGFAAALLSDESISRWYKVTAVLIIYPAALFLSAWFLIQIP